MYKYLLPRKVQLAFGAALLTLLAVGVISYRGMVASSESLGQTRMILTLAPP